MTAAPVEPLVTVVTTDFASVTRGRSVTAARFEHVADTGIGWLPANLSLTCFNTIADPNPWGSRGDLRIIPDRGARYQTNATGCETPLDFVMGDIVELDGMAWPGCSRTLLRAALDDLKAATGLTLVAAFEQEFQVFDGSFPTAHALSLQAQRRTDPFGPRLMAACTEAGIQPEVFLAEFALDQFEITCAPAAAVTAADRAVAIREITREVVRNLGWRASFAPKTHPDSVGNGVHIHFSLMDADGHPATYDPEGTGGLSEVAGAFCAGMLRHLPALTALTAASVPSYYRLKPHCWSASYTWLAEREREAALRICPTTSVGGQDPAAQFNIEYRAADATGNPYLSLAAIVRAGLQGINDDLSPALVADDPGAMSETDRARLGLVRLPETLEAALAALEADHVVGSWFAPAVIESFTGVKRAEMAMLESLDEHAICERYREAY